MNPQIFNQSKNLFLIFPGGSGGNHLANLLSMCSGFAQRYSMPPDQYINNMKERYQKFEIRHGETAHFSDLENLDNSLLSKYTDDIVNSNGIYIFCAHALEYSIRKQDGSLKPFENQIFCLFTLPKDINSLINKRINNGPWIFGECLDMSIKCLNKPKPEKVYELYDPAAFCNVNQISMDQVVVFDTEKFYTADGYDYIANFVSENFSTKLPECCRDMHTLYVLNNEMGYSKYLNS